MFYIYYLHPLIIIHCLCFVVKAVYSGGKKLTLILQQQQVIKSNKSNKFDNPTTNKQMQLERRRVVGGD